MSLSEANSQVRQFLTIWSYEELGESPPGAPEKAASIDVLPGDLEGVAVWYLPDLVGSPNLRSGASIYGDYGRLPEVCSVASESISLLVADLISLVVHGV